MLTYLADGWFSRTQPQHLSTAVLDGVLDSAGLLVHAGVPSDAVLTLRQLLVRHSDQAGLAQPPGSRKPAEAGMGPGARRQMLLEHILDRTDGSPTLQSFMVDCLESATDGPSWRALCMHLAHIGQAMQLLHAARTVRRDNDHDGAGTLERAARAPGAGHARVARS